MLRSENGPTSDEPAKQRPSVQLTNELEEPFEGSDADELAPYYDSRPETDQGPDLEEGASTNPINPATGGPSGQPTQGPGQEAIGHSFEEWVERAWVERDGGPTKGAFHGISIPDVPVSDGNGLERFATVKIEHLDATTEPFIVFPSADGYRHSSYMRTLLETTEISAFIIHENFT